MSNQIDKYTKRRLTTSFIYSTLSISVVLYMIGLLLIIIYSGSKISTYVKENIGFSVFMHNETKEIDILTFQKSLDISPFAKSTEYISQDQAAKEVQKSLGENVIDITGSNPLPPTIDIRLKSDYTNPDSLKKIEKQLLSNPIIKEITYSKPVVDVINNNFKKISYSLLAISFVLILISILLIHSTIRLSVYSKRFIIRSMLLVGASRRFIQRPFIIKGIIQGLWASIIAILLLSGTLYAGMYYFADIFNASDIDVYLIIFALTTGFGIFFSWTSTTLAVRKFIKMKTDNLYQ
ncbi:MAG: permease-like cell division protein FtsX [Bacteroidota bacterium]